MRRPARATSGSRRLKLSADFDWNLPLPPRSKRTMRQGTGGTQVRGWLWSVQPFAPGRYATTGELSVTCGESQMSTRQLSPPTVDCEVPHREILFREQRLRQLGRALQNRSLDQRGRWERRGLLRLNRPGRERRGLHAARRWRGRHRSSPGSWLHAARRWRGRHLFERGCGRNGRGRNGRGRNLSSPGSLLQCGDGGRWGRQGLLRWHGRRLFERGIGRRVFEQFIQPGLGPNLSSPGSPLVR